jgi:hypothetical protein
MSQRDRFLLALVIPVLLVGGVWFLLLSPKRKEAEKLDTQIAAAQTRLGTAQSDLARYEAARQALAANMRSLAQAGRAVPASAAMPALLRQLERTGERTRVELQSVSTDGDGKSAAAPAAPAPAAAGDGAAPAAAPAAEPTPINLTLSFEGRFFDVQRFFTRLDRFIRISREQVEATGRLMAVRDLSLVGKDGRLTAQVQTSVYVLPDLASLLPATPGAPAAAPVADAGSAAPGGAVAAVGVAR